MPEFRYILIERYPLLELSVDASAPRAELVAATQREFEFFFEHDVPYAMLLDGTQGSVPTSSERRQWVEWMGEHRDALQRLNRGVAMFHPQTLMRGMMTAFSWWSGLPYELKYTATREEAIAWLKERTSDLEGQKPHFG